MEDVRLINCGGMVVHGDGGGGGGGMTFNPRRPVRLFNFYWNITFKKSNSIILPKSVDFPQVSASNI